MKGSRPLLAVLRESKRPVVLSLGKKKRRRYSKGLRDLQKSMAASARAGEHAADALAAGADRYRRRVEASARKKRDGILKDFWKNSADALDVVLRKSRRLPRELARTVRPGTIRRRIRLLRLLGGLV